MKINKKRLSNLFIELCEITSPSGDEKKMAEYLCDYFNTLRWKVWTDTSGKLNNSSTGNVYAYLEKDKSLETLMFCAHMDTVQNSDTIIVSFDGKIFSSRGNTILGADNKAGIATLLYSAKYIDLEKLHHNILLFFPTREESGLMGSTYFDSKNNPVKYAFNIDGSGKPGKFVTKSLGFVAFDIEVVGKSAHAALEYDKGINALRIASELITQLPLGTFPKHTLNIGSLVSEGSTNVVPERAYLKGELRGFTKNDIDNELRNIETLCKTISNKSQAKIMVKVDEESYLEPFDQTENKDLLKTCNEVCRKIGLQVDFETAYYCSDANSLSSKNIATINVSRGGEGGHSHLEKLAYQDLKTATYLVRSLMHAYYE